MKILYGLFITILFVFLAINIRADQTSISTSFAVKTYTAKDSTKAKKKNLKVKKIKQTVKAVDNGIGPIKTVKLGKINKKLVEHGRQVFLTKCSACHQLDSRVVGPALRNITKTRSPVFLMNFLLNTKEMQEKDASVKKLIREYNGMLMPDQNLTKRHARALLEYFRSVVKKKNLKVKKIKRSVKAVDKGIGPIKTVKLGKINEELVEHGKQLFFTKCSACHQLDSRLVGPPLRNIAKTRSPEFIMNFLLNTREMQEKDVFVKKSIKEYNGILMPDQHLTRRHARALLEYFRSVAKKK